MNGQCLRRSSLSLTLALVLAACAADAPRESIRAADTTTTAVTVMTFNVENLFDNIDDPDKDDKAYLPLAAKQTTAHKNACGEIEVNRWRDECLHLDWNDDILDFKMTVLAKTILQVNDGRGADIIALQEVENISALEQLRTSYLADAGYLPAILIEGTDKRGIDVAFLSRLPLAQPPRLHPLELSEDYADRAGDTRGVLEATFELPDGSLLTGFSVHFPAPFHPTAMRIAAYNHLDALRQTVPPQHNVFAAGDFNTTSTEDAREGMLDRFVRPTWTVAHELCNGCPGTHYYPRDDVWSFLDMILYAPGNDAGSRWRLDRKSVRLAASFKEQLREDRSPRRFNAAARTGVSDHLPLLIEIEATR